MTYLSFDPNTFRESDSSSSPAHIEYLALQALGAAWPRRDNIEPEESLELTNEALSLVREIFNDEHALLSIGLLDKAGANPDKSNELEYAHRARLQSLSVRSSGYAECVIKVFTEVFDPFNREIESILGFSAIDVAIIAQAMGPLLNSRLEQRQDEIQKKYDDIERKIKRARRGKTTPGFSPSPELLQASWPKVQAHLRFSYVAELFAHPCELFAYTPEDLSEYCSISVESCEAFLIAFSCEPSEFNELHHALPGGAHPLTESPIIQVNEGYIVPVIGTIHDTLRPRLEDLIRNSSPKLWEKYLRFRGKYLESKSVELLSKALPGTQSWQGIKWQSPTANSELDGLVGTDSFTIRVQCKAGRLSAPTRRGAIDRMRRDIGALIQSAAHQHELLATASEESSYADLGFSDSQAAALEAPIQIESIVCLDDVTVWSTLTGELAKIGLISDTRPIPWVLSLTDLLVVVELLDGTSLIHYLLRRHRLERDGRITAHDELDWVGNYISEGLYFDWAFNSPEPPDRIFLTTYTEEIDSWYFWRAGHRSVVTPKPEQPIPPSLLRFIRRLEVERPAGWVIAAIALINGDDECLDLWERNLKVVNQKISENGWTNATQTFKERFGVTLFFDRRLGVPDVETQLREYCLMKMKQLELAHWVGVTENRSGKLVVGLFSSTDSDIREFIQLFTH